jgi:hypothetical protein
MKNLMILMVLGLLLCPLSACAGDGQPTYFQFGISDPIQLFPSTASVAGLRLDLLMGVNDNVEGIDVGLVNRVTGSGSGFEFGIFNSVGEDYRGLQIGLLANITSVSEGVQVGIYNRAAQGMYGFQVGIVNRAGALDGVQIGLINVDEQTQSRGFWPLVYAKF